MTLAGALGDTVAELKQRISYREFLRWREFHLHEPVGGARGDIQTALLMTLLANIHRDPKQRSKPFQLDDFLLDWWPVPQSAQSLQQKFMAISQELGLRNDMGKSEIDDGRN